MTKDLFRDDAYLRECAATVKASSAEGVILDQTVFYPTGGGQPGDTGKLIWEGGETTIAESRKGADSAQIVHIPQEGALLPPTGATVTAVIDWDRRHRLMRMHTCMHLLSAIVDGEITGGQVGDGKGRVDFNLPETSIDKDAVGDSLNKLIEADHPVSADWITDAELDRRPDLIKTMSVKPPVGAGQVRLMRIGDGVDLQPCGGTHVARTGEIGPVEIGKIENKGRQNRRINLRLATP
jgi:misacylated tRNA(Ala) deacylase